MVICFLAYDVSEWYCIVTNESDQPMVVHLVYGRVPKSYPALDSPFAVSNLHNAHDTHLESGSLLNMGYVKQKIEMWKIVSMIDVAMLNRLLRRS